MNGKKVLKKDVAPRAGAWIETEKNVVKAEKTESHPVRVRGLKHVGF